MATVLAFDIGLARTGVACGETIHQTSNLAGSLAVKRGRHNWQAVDDLIADWQPSLILVGQPHTDDPALNKAINRFKHHIQQQHKLPIIDIDETLTSAAANHDLSQQGLATERKTQLRDQLAARYLLDTYYGTLD